MQAPEELEEKAVEIKEWKDKFEAAERMLLQST